MSPAQVVGVVVAHVAVIALVAVLVALVRRRPRRDDDAPPGEGRRLGNRPD
ncbi:hypothetical protein AB0C12_24880 [Actinoplanes sp. NPDC048967]|uniref:hypothetical protein n=1 Tax=Actinoplanes sp. NPDC048967 TaxID=3155269 RepID=UPI0033CDA2B3